jgi:Uncharacterized protein conserved in bacteria (DUF2147)
MKTITLAAAAMLLASTAAYAGGNSYNFEIQGQKIRIEAPKNCSSLSCIQITAPGLSGINLKGLKSGRDDDDVATTSTPAASPAPPAPPAPPPVTQTTTAPQAPAVNYPPPPATVATTDQPLLHDVVPGAPQPPAVVPPAPPAPPAPPPVVAASPPVAQQPVAAAAPTTPIGVWSTEDNKGNVKIEQCGANLCGYAADTREKILINMKPQDSKWTGQIHDPDSGRNYDSTIAMKGPNILKVQGCAFGGLFCGGQTWKRIS